MSGVFFDGRIAGCVCDRDGWCEMPCWQRVGLTDDPCCPGCAPLPPVDGPEHDEEATT
jgi:hypothetical protein